MPVPKLQHLLLVLGIMHVDEVDDNDATQIAQPQLPCNRLGCFQVVLNIVLPDCPPQKPCVDIHSVIAWSGRKSGGSGFQQHFAFQGALYLLLDSVKFE